jgi:hypothetical protein
MLSHQENPKGLLTPPRIATVGIVILAVFLALWPQHDPGRLQIPDPWGYDFAIRNFAQGKWTVTDQEILEERFQLRLQGGDLTMYVPIASNEWAFRKSPGYPLLTIPFQWMQQPGLANALLTVLGAFTLYVWLAKWRDEFTACLGVAILLFTPMSLLAAHYSTMDTYASGMTLVAGGALILLYDAEEGKSDYARGILFGAGLLIGWGVVVRIQNVLILLVLVPYLLGALRWHQAWGSRQGKGHAIAFFSGLMITLGILAVYNWAVFGRVVDTGYQYASPYQFLFIWNREPGPNILGTQTWFDEPSLRSFLIALVDHAIKWPGPLLRGWPLLPLALIGLGVRFWQRPVQPKSYLMAAWLLATYVLYAGIVYFGITRELTVPFYRTSGFFAVDRYLFPASLPIAFLAAEGISLLPRWLSSGSTVLFVIGSAAWYLRFLG